MPSPRTTWSAGVAVAGLLVVVGIAGIALVRYGPLTGPWAYGAFGLAALGAVGATLLCVARAHGVDE
jgi:hypothetical protein